MAKQKKGTRVPFTEEQLVILKDSSLEDLKLLVDEWGRSYDSLRRKRYQLLHFDNDRESKRNYKRTLQKKVKAKYVYNPWTLAEEQELLSSKRSDVEIAKKLNRSVAAIWSKRHQLMKKGKTNGHGYRPGNTEDTIPFPFAE